MRFGAGCAARRPQPRRVGDVDRSTRRAASEGRFRHALTVVNEGGTRIPLTGQRPEDRARSPAVDGPVECGGAASCHSRGPARAGRSSRPRRLVGRHAGAARHGAPLRCRHHRRRLGADLVQPRAGRLRRSGRASRSTPPPRASARRGWSCSRPRRSPAGSRPPSRCSLPHGACRRSGRRSWSLRRSSCSPGWRDRSSARRTCGRAPACSVRRSAPPSAASSRSSPGGRRSSSLRRRWRCCRCSPSGASRFPCRGPSSGGQARMPGPTWRCCSGRRR